VSTVDLVSLLPLILIVLVFYLLIIRPARNRQRQALALQGALRPGLEVMTTAGLIATVSAVKDDEVVLEVAPGVLCRYAKPAVARVITPPDTGSSADPATEGTDA